MSTIDRVIVGAALLLVGISLLSPGGLIVGAALGVLLLVGYYGGAYLLDLEKSRRMGERGSIRDTMRTAGDRERWER